MNEIWKPIKGFEGIYEVSSFGRVKSLQRLDSRGNRVNECILITTIEKIGYERVNLRKGNGYVRKSIHRLVAEAFIPNPNNLPQVNHKNENKADNRVDNLEWCTAKYNSCYGTRMSRLTQGLEKEIIQYTLDGKELARYKSLKDAAKAIGVKYCGGIAVAANHYVDKHGSIHQTAYGYRWEYADVLQDNKRNEIDEQ